MALAVPQRALAALAQPLAPTVATPTLVVTAARPLLDKSAPLPLWLLLPAVAVAEAVSLPLLQLPTRVLEAWVTLLALLAVKLLAAQPVARAWVATVEPTRRLPKAQEPVAVAVEHTLPMQAAPAVLAETRVAVAAGVVHL